MTSSLKSASTCVENSAGESVNRKQVVFAGEGDREGALGPHLLLGPHHPLRYHVRQHAAVLFSVREVCEAQPGGRQHPVLMDGAGGRRWVSNFRNILTPELLETDCRVHTCV